MNIKKPLRIPFLVMTFVVLFIQPPCDLALAVYKDFLSFARRDTPVPLLTETPGLMGYKELVPTEELQAAVETAGARSDAEFCDAIEFIEVVADAQVENSKDDGSYSCYIEYTFTNIHPSSQIIISWKHTISSRKLGPYWTHPPLSPGEKYPLSLTSNKSTKGVWRTVDANNLIAWFATDSCDRYVKEYWPIKTAEPDKLLSSGLTRVELINPCRR